MKPVIIWIGIGLLMSVHFFAGKLRWLHVIPRSRWLSMAGGVSVAYVFLHLLPELSRAQTHFKEYSSNQVIRYLEHHIYVMALVGLAIFYGLERMAIRSKGDRQQPAEEERASQGVFWIHMVSFAGYNLLIGYLVFNLENPSPRNTWIFITAMALHFLVNDYGLAEHHKDAYRTKGKWVLGIAVLLGGLAGTFARVAEGVLFTALSFLAGGIILNVLKEELPERRQSRFWAFSAGALGYGFLLLLF